MNVREKLVELFYDNNVRCDQKIEGLADDLMDIIDNCVTVQEWVSVKDRPPEMPPDKIAEGYVQMQVLVWCDKGRQCAWFQVDTKTFYDQPGLFGTEVDGVTHWMPLPQPPKGE